MNRTVVSALAVGVLFSAGRVQGVSNSPTMRWSLAKDLRGIEWIVEDDEALPHGDHLEMAGRKTAIILDYGVTREGWLRTGASLFWPTHRLMAKTCPNHLSFSCPHEDMPRVMVGGRPLRERAVRISFDGVWRSESVTDEGLSVKRTVFPSVDSAAAFELVEVRNGGIAPCALSAVGVFRRETQGARATYVCEADVSPVGEKTLKPGDVAQWAIGFVSWAKGTEKPTFEVDAEYAKRRRRIEELASQAVLKTEVPEFDVAFRLAKIRTGEAIFATEDGLMHSPGGGKFYGGIWTNDDLEYVGPWFAITGDKTEFDAQLNACRLYMKYMRGDYGKLPGSIHAGGGDWSEKERGDAAMFAVGAVKFALLSGDRDVAERLLPGIEWALEFCRRKLLPEGVVSSGCDELEYRYSAGTANLNTSCMYYDALKDAAALERALGRAEKAAGYAARAAEMPGRIESYFGADVRGFRTYRYHEGNEKLRAWIGAPLCVGLYGRAEGTAAALFSPRVWSGHDMLTEEGDPLRVRWDRSLLFAFRGVLSAGLLETALPRLLDYTRARLLGEHVPYAIEQWPYRRGAHLAAEGALYCRIFTEGLFGVVPTGLGEYTVNARLPPGWERMSLGNVRLGGRNVDVVVTRYGTSVTEHK